ncbi:MAG: FtsX-like permease family protein [Candidatus Odinarchaeota archaeon]
MFSITDLTIFAITKILLALSKTYLTSSSENGGLITVIFSKIVSLFWVSKVNFRPAVVSFIVLTLALSMLAGSLYYTEFSRYDLYRDSLEEVESRLGGRVEYYFEFSSNPVTTVMSAKNNLEQEIHQHGLEHVLKNVSTSCFIDSFKLVGESVLVETVISGHQGLNETILDECIPSSRFPVNRSEILVYAPDDNRLSIDDQIAVPIIYQLGTEGFGILQFNFTIAGIITNSSMSEHSPYRELLPDDGYRYFTSLEFFLLQAEDAFPYVLGPPGIKILTILTLDFDASDVNSVETTKSVASILAMEQSLAEYSTIRTDKGVSTLLRSKIMDVETFLSFFSLLSIPIVILATFIVFFALETVKGERLKALVMIKARGGSKRFIFLLLFIEMVIITLIAATISVIAGILLATFIGKTSGFLTFTRNVTISNYLRAINPNTLLQQLVFGTGLVVLTHVPNIFKLTRLDTAISEWEIKKEKKSKIRIPTGMIDVLLLTTGIIGLVIVNLFLDMLGIISTLDIFESEWDFLEFSQLFAPFIFLFMLFSPLFIIIGMIMFLNRIIQLVIPILGRFFWKRGQRLLAVAFKQLAVNVKLTARTTMVLAITISFLVILSALPLSVQHYNEDTIYYENGADIVINIGDATDQEITNITMALREIDGLKTTSIIYAELNYRIYRVSIVTGTFLGIQPDFYEVAHWKKYYGEESLESLVAMLYASQEPVPAIVDSRTAEMLEHVNPVPLTRVVASLGSQSELIAKEISPVAITDYFPALYKRSYSSEQGYYVCKYSFIANLNELEARNFVIQRKILGKIVNGDPSSVTEKARSSLEELGYDGNVLYSVPEELAYSRNSLSSILIWLVVNYNLLGGLIVALITIILFSAVRALQTTPIIGFSRSMGMKFPQTLLIKTTELFLLVLLSIISGCAISLSVMAVITPALFRGIAWGPPFVLAFDLQVILVVFGLLLLSAFLIGMITSILFISRNVSSMLRCGYTESPMSTEIMHYVPRTSRKHAGTGKKLKKLNRRKFGIAISLSRANLKLLFGSLIGIIVALSMLSASLWYTEVSRPEMYLGFFQQEGYDQLRFISWSRLDGGKSVEEIMDLEKFLEQKISQYGLEQLLVKNPFSISSNLHEMTSFQNQIDFQMIRGYYGINDSLLDECVAGSRLPINETEVLVIAPADTTLTINDEVEVILNYSDGLTNKFHGLNLTVTGIFTAFTIDEDSIIRKLFSLDEYHFILPLDSFIKLVYNIEEDLGGIGETKSLDLVNFFTFDIDYRNIDRDRVVESVETLAAFLNEMIMLYKAQKTAIQCDPFFFSKFTLWTLGLYIFLIQFLIFSAPVFLLVAVLVLFSLGLVNEKRLKAVALLKNRGFSGRIVFAVLLLETIFIALLAIGTSTVVGLLIAMFTGTSNGFLAFKNDVSGYSLDIAPLPLLLLFITGIAFTFLTHLPSIISLSRSSITSLEKSASKKKKRKLMLLISQLDVILLVIGLLGMIILTIFIELYRKASYQTSSDTLLFFLPFLTLFAFVSPFLFLIGCIFSYNRFIPPGLHLLGRIFWKRDWRLLAKTTRSLSANVKLTARTTLLIAVTISFLVSLVILPYSIQLYLEDSRQYSTGADFTMVLPTLSEDQFEELMTSLEDIDGLNVTRISRAVFEPVTAITGKQRAYFLGIESDFASVAHWKDHYDDESLEELVFTLFNSPFGSATIVDATTAKTLTLGQALNIPLHLQESLKIIPVAIANNFPGIVDSWLPENYYIVCRYSQMTNITNLSRLQLEHEIWGNILPGYDKVAVTVQARKTIERLGFDGSDLRSVLEDIDQSKSGRDTKLTWQAINYSFLGGLAAIIIVFILHAFASITRSTREIGLDRALGMKKHQFFLLMLTEPIIMFILAGIPGGIIGIVLIAGLLGIFGQSLFWGPPFVLNLNLAAIISVYGFILLVMIIIGVTISIVAIRANISNILKAE